MVQLDHMEGGTHPEKVCVDGPNEEILVIHGFLNCWDVVCKPSELNGGEVVAKGQTSLRFQLVRALSKLACL